jgi:hypothetical protein
MQTPEAPPPLAGGPDAGPGAALETAMRGEWDVFGIPGTYLMWGTVAFAAIWLASTVFIHMRRRATNLTSAQQASVRKDAAPDFMKVDHKAREAAMKRGETFDQELVEREKAEAAAAAAAAGGKPARREPVNMVRMISGIAAFAFSLFTLLGTILGTFRTLDGAGVQLSKLDQVGAIISQNPIPTLICVFVIGYTIYIWISQKKWADPPKI